MDETLVQARCLDCVSSLITSRSARDIGRPCHPLRSRTARAYDIHDCTRTTNYNNDCRSIWYIVIPSHGLRDHIIH